MSDMFLNSQARVMIRLNPAEADKFNHEKDIFIVR